MRQRIQKEKSNDKSTGMITYCIILHTSPISSSYIEPFV